MNIKDISSYIEQKSTQAITKEEIKEFERIHSKVGNIIRKSESKTSSSLSVDLFDLMEKTDDGVLLKDENLNIIYANSAFCNFIGKSLDEIKNVRINTIFPTKTANEILQRDKEALSNKKSPTEIIKIASKNNEPIRVWSQRLVYENPAGETFLINIIKDLKKLYADNKADFHKIQYNDFMVQSALEYVQMVDSQNLYQHIADKIEQLTPGAKVVVSSVNQKKGELKTEAVSGFGYLFVKISQLLGFNILGKSFQIMDIADRELRTGKLVNVRNGIYDLTMRSIPKPLSKQVERLLNVDYIYSIGILGKDGFFGTVCIMTKNRIPGFQIEMLEGFVHQSSVVLQKKEAEIAITQEKKLSEQVFELNPFAIAVFNESGSATRINHACKKIFNVRNCKAFNDLDFLTKINLNASDIKQTLDRLSYLRIPEVEYDQKKEKFYLRIIFYRLQHNSSIEPKFIMTCEDISKRKKTEWKLQENEEKYRTIFENIQGVYFEVSLSEVILEISPFISEYIPEKREELIGTSKHLNYIPKKEKNQFLNDIKNKKEVRNIELPYKQKDNKWGFLSISAKVVYDYKIQEQKIIGILTEITEQKKGEVRLKAALKEKEILLREVHHRVKNNLQVIISLINLQNKKITDPVISDNLNALKNRVRSMALVHESLYNSKNISRINIQNYIKDIVNHLIHAHLMENKNDVQFNINAKDILMDIDTAVSCGLIINELVSNSLKHGFSISKNQRSGNANISIQLVEKDNEYKLMVSDNGSGYVPTDSNRVKSLGLWLVKMLVVEQLGGDITINSSEGYQTIISFSTVELSKHDK